MLLARLVVAFRRVTSARAAARLRGFHSPRELNRILHREQARADRSGEVFSLVVFTPDDSGTAAAALRILGRILKRRLRSTDEVGWVDDRRLGAVLPSTPAWGAWKVAGDVCRSLPAKVPSPRCQVYSYPGDGQEVDRPERKARTRAGSPPRPEEQTGFKDDTRAGGKTRAEGQVPSDAARKPAVADNAVQAMQPLLIRKMPLWKRLLDVAGAGFGLVVAAPLMAAIAFGVKWSSPGPILFRQWRSGLGGKPFVIYKFRSMVADAESHKAGLRDLNEQDGPAFKMETDPRVTRLGRLLRSTSLDELPQLWNVLQGEMSLVGPRPLPCDESEACRGWQRRRLDVTPGLTCIWQVRGRSKVSFADWVRMDLQYIHSRSLWQDAKLLLLTLLAVVRRRGV
jgi:lipopolysaccharide/colanic/teichoic acid biosynthesis glycosyltransferase